MQWAFRCYLSGSGNCEIKEWYDELPLKLQAKFDWVSEYLEERPINDWMTSPFITHLTGYEGIYEIKFQGGNYVGRPLGCFGPGDQEFTFLIGAREKGNDFVPKNAPKLAQSRKAIVHKVKERSHEKCF